MCLKRMGLGNTSLETRKARKKGEQKESRRERRDGRGQARKEGRQEEEASIAKGGGYVIN